MGMAITDQYNVNFIVNIIDTAKGYFFEFFV